MLRLQTKTEKSVPFERGFIMVIVHLIIEQIVTTANSITATGYYYYFDENGNIVKPPKGEIKTEMQIALFEQIENNFLGALDSTQNTNQNNLQRLKEMTLMNIDQEQGFSYGIVRTDLIPDN